MAINIKEILTNDSEIIKVDKTNYNFDQLVANGGGPIGIKGQKGELGSVGNTGAKGQKGDDGAKGEVGPTGADVNNWGRVDHTSTSDTSILKPKKDTDDTEPASIILGDTDYVDGSVDGIVDPNAWLNIVIPDTSAVYSNFVSLLNSTTSKVNFSSTTLSGVDTYKITHDISSSNDVNFEINVKNEVLVNGATGLNLTSGGIINVDAGNNDVVIGPTGSTSTAKLDVRFNSSFVRGNLTIDGIATGGFVKIPVGTTAQRPTGALGMIRYNSDLDVGFSSNVGSPEAYVPHPDGNYWKPLGTLVDADGDTFISPDYDAIDGTENVITISVGEDTGGGTYIKDFVGTIGDTVVDGSINLERAFQYNNVIYAVNDVLVANDKGLRIKQNTTSPGSSQVAAQNNGAVAGNRTLVDYFYRESASQYNLSTYSDSTPFTNSLIDANPTEYRYTNDAIIAQGYITASINRAPVNVGIIVRGNTTKMSYVKIGHMVTVWGRLDYFPYSVDAANLESGDCNFDGATQSGTIPTPVSRRAAFTIGRPEDFPYTSSLTNNRVIFPISVSVKAQDGTDGEVNSSFYGVIQPGTNVFNIIESDDRLGFIQGTTIENVNDHYAKFLNIDDLKLTAINPEAVITLEYSFSMPTDINSYDLASDSIQNYAETDIQFARSEQPVLDGGITR